MNHIFEEIAAERKRQHEKWGEQNWPMIGQTRTRLIIDREPYPSKDLLTTDLLMFRERNKTDMKGWFDILQEEVYEVFAETDPRRQREEMIQVAAVAVQIIEHLDRQIEESKQ